MTIIRNGGSADYRVISIKEDIKTILSASKKFAIALKSLSEGYVLGNPNGKSYVNDQLKSSMIFNFLKHANDLRTIIGAPQEPVFDLLIR